MEDRIISMTREEGAALDKLNRERIDKYKDYHYATVTVYDNRRKNHYNLNQRSMGFPSKNDSIKWAKTVPNRACNKIILKHKNNVEYYDLAA